jgi:putative transposase
MDDKLTHKKQQQLERITSRDTTVIRRYLTIIENEEQSLWLDGKEGKRLDVNKLDSFTLTSKPLKRKGKNGVIRVTTGRPSVKYDLKREFKGRITARELKECRDTAVSMWQAYCQQLSKYEWMFQKLLVDNRHIERKNELIQNLHRLNVEKKPQPPCQARRYKPRKIPRRANFGITIFLHKREKKLTRYWLEVYYPEKRKHLWLPLNPSCYHLNQLVKGKCKAVQLIKHTNRRWYVHITINIKIPDGYAKSKPPAVLGIDLGIKKAAVAVLLTANGNGVLKRQDIRFFKQPDKKRAINKLDNLITSLQRRLEWYRKKNRRTDQITHRLRRIARERKKIAKQLDHDLTTSIMQWIGKINHQYNIYVAMGQLKGIRRSRRKGDNKSRKYRRELHKWSFARVTTMLKYKFMLKGIPANNFVTISESWTSKTCNKCNSRNTSRPFQAFIVCQSCGAKLQADINGAINIALKLIMSLDEVALDQWLTNPLFIKKFSTKRVRATGWKTSYIRRFSLTSKPRSGDETSPIVYLDVEPANSELSSRHPSSRGDMN